MTPKVFFPSIAKLARPQLAVAKLSKNRREQNTVKSPRVVIRGLNLLIPSNYNFNT